jgi:DNA-binding transcriptional ArsR family regulator
VLLNIFKYVSHFSIYWINLKEADQRLKNLTDSEVCLARNPEKYKNDLINLAEETADPKKSRKQSKYFKALSDEKRIRILKLLTVREMCVCELMIALDTTQPNLSHHLKILENQGFVNRRKEGKWAYYSLNNPKYMEQLLKSYLP